MSAVWFPLDECGTFPLVSADNKIQQLSHRLKAAESEEEVAQLGAELRAALHDHTEALRDKVRASLPTENRLKSARP